LIFKITKVSVLTHLWLFTIKLLLPCVQIVLHTVYSVRVAVTWLQSTFLYVRAQRNPRFYGLPNDQRELLTKLSGE